MSTLKDFIAQQKSGASAAPAVDWARRRDKWLQELELLYSRIRSMLLAAGLEDEALRTTSYDLREEKLGAYTAPGLDIQLPAGTVHFTPIASVILGGYGLVTVTGPDKRTAVKLVADDRDENRPAEDETPSYERDWEWRVYPRAGTRNSFALDEEGLRKVLEAVSR